MQRTHEQSHGASTTVVYTDTSTTADSQHSMSGVVRQVQPQKYDKQFELSGDATARATGTIHDSKDAIYYQGMRVISEQVTEHTELIPSQRIVEETVMKTVVVPEVVRRVEEVNEERTIREKIVELEVPVDKVKYVDDITQVTREVLKPVTQTITQEKIVHKEVVHDEVVTKRVPKYIEREKTVEYEVSQIVNVPVHRVVEVPETRIIEKIIEKPVNQIIEVEVPEYRTVEVMEEIVRNVPVPMETVTNVVYHLPAIQAEYEEVPFPVHVPTFVQVPVPAEYLTEKAMMEVENLKQAIALATSGGMPSMCVLEDLGNQARRMQPDLIDDPAVWDKRMTDKISQVSERMRRETAEGN